MEQRPAPVQVLIGGTTGLLLVRLMEELKTDDSGGVISRALSLYELALRKQRAGLRVCVVDPETGQASDLAL